MKGGSLRRQPRHTNQPSVSQGSDAPVSLVFRTHTESLSKAAFLFCPKNFNLTNPVTSAANASPMTSGSTARYAGSSPGGAHEAFPTTSAGASNTTSSIPSSSPTSKRFPASASSVAASSTLAESVQTLVEAIVELRPSFTTATAATGTTTTTNTNNNTTTAMSATPSSPLATTHTSPGESSNPSFHGYMARPFSSSGSLGLGSYVDLMSLSSFASPTLNNNGTIGNGSISNGSLGLSTSGTPSALTAGGGRCADAVPPPSASMRGGAGANSGGVPSAGAAGQDLPQHTMGTSSINAYSGGGVGGVNVSGGSGSGGNANSSGNGNSGGAAGAGSVSAVAATNPSLLMHPSGGWICRAMAFNEKEVGHANGAISVSQSLTSKCPLINEVAKGKTMARILSSYQEVQERYGLTHVEVTVDNQYVSRSDMFLISEALRERILYEGEEIHLCGFRFRVREMLQGVVAGNGGNGATASSPAIPVPSASMQQSANGLNAATAAGGGGGSTATAAPAAAAAGPTSYMRVGCGIVLPTTRINFQSLSPVYYVLIELSCEMWETTIDGRIALTWAIRKFVSELLLKQLPKRKASPLVRVVFTGRLRKEFQFDRHTDVFHMLELPREVRNVDVVEEIRMHCEALVERILREVQATAWRQLDEEIKTYREGSGGSTNSAHGGNGGGGSTSLSGDAMQEESGGSAKQRRDSTDDAIRGGFPRRAAAAPTAATPAMDGVFEAYVRDRQTYIENVTAKRLFVHAKQSNTLEALSILIERCNHHYIDRHLTLCGHAVTVVSAGKGFYQVTNSLVQIVCARLHDMGLEKVNVVCIGRPPLHVTPLLEYTSDDDTLRSQYHLHSRVLSGTAAAATTPPSLGAGSLGYGGTSGEVERYYETPEWMSIFFFHSALHNNGGETAFELLPKDCWQREHPVMAALDALWPSPEHRQQQGPRASSFKAGSTSVTPARRSGGHSKGNGSAIEVDGGEAEANFGVVSGGLLESDEYREGTQRDGTLGDNTAAALGPNNGVTNASATRAASTASAMNPAVLIPGLGLRSYPVLEVILPVRSAGLVMSDYVDRGSSGLHSVAGMHPASLNGLRMFPASPGASASPTRPLRPFFTDAHDASGTASHCTEAIPSPTSPFHAHSFSRHRGTGESYSGGLGFGSPTSPSGHYASSTPLLTRTTTASSSVFASPNIPMRGSIPRGGLHALTGWKEHPHAGQQPPHLLHSAYPHDFAHPPPATAPQQQPQRRHGSTTSISTMGSSHARNAETTGANWSVPQRRTRGAAPATTAHISIRAASLDRTGSGDRSSLPGSFTWYGTAEQAPLHISRSFDHKTTANPEYHSLGAFEHAVRTAGSSSAAGRHATACPQGRSPGLLGWRENTNITLNPAMTSVDTTSGGPATNVYTNANATPTGRTATPLQQRVDERGNAMGTVASMTAAFAGPFARCTWYCLHAAKPHQEGVSTGNGLGGGGASVNASAAANGMAVSAAAAAGATAGGVGGGGSNTAAATSVRGNRAMGKSGSAPSGPAATGRSLLRAANSGGIGGGAPLHATVNDVTSAVLHTPPAVTAPTTAATTSATSAVHVVTPPAALTARADTTTVPIVKPWHKAASSTRPDTVFCGCNVVDSDLRNGYLILEITIDAALLPHCFWSPLLIIDDHYWSCLMNCFTGRDDRVTLEEEDAESACLSEEEVFDGEDAMTVSLESSTDDGAFNETLRSVATAKMTSSAGSLLRGNSDGRRGKGMVGGGGDPDTGGGGPRHSTASGTGEVYRFQSDFRPSEVFCRSHSGITADGRTLIIPTHNNSVHFQSSEEILLRLQPRLFVPVVDEGGDVAVERRGPVSPTSSHHVATELDEDDRGVSTVEGPSRQSSTPLESHSALPEDLLQRRPHTSEVLSEGEVADAAGHAHAHTRRHKDAMREEAGMATHAPLPSKSLSGLLARVDAAPAAAAPLEKDGASRTGSAGPDLKNALHSSFAGAAAAGGFGDRSRATSTNADLSETPPAAAAIGATLSSTKGGTTSAPSSRVATPAAQPSSPLHSPVSLSPNMAASADNRKTPSPHLGAASSTGANTVSAARRGCGGGAAVNAQTTVAPIHPVPLQLPPTPTMTHVSTTTAPSSSSAAAAVPSAVTSIPPRSPSSQSGEHEGSNTGCMTKPETEAAGAGAGNDPANHTAHAMPAPHMHSHRTSAFHSCIPKTIITVGFVQLRNSLLFAIKPINPLRPGADEEQREDITALSQSAESVSTATVLRRRWQCKHPDIWAEPPHLASWTRLCTCRLLPLYGSKPAYPREGFYTVSPHQYTVTKPGVAGGGGGGAGGASGAHADTADERKRLLEFVLQRLQQQYQIVVDSAGLAAGAQWPRADPSPNARLEMSLGHQTHTLKVGETAKTISVTRMLHRGMYSNGQITHMLSYRYLLWNYLADDFSLREVHMEEQVGERNAFRWESLDRWLQGRPQAYIPRGPDLWLRSREIAVMLLPEDTAHPPSFEEFYRFIGYRFSVHLSTHGKVEWKRHDSGIAMDMPMAAALSFPPAPSLMEVVLVHDNPLTLDTRNVVDRITGRTVAFDVPIEERYMSVDVSLPQQYDPHCCYFLKVSWLACAASIVVDWYGSFIANASRFRFHAVPIACYYNSPKAESLTAHYDVEAYSAEEEPHLRRALAELLTTAPYRYYPDTPRITRNCRLVHISGLCSVLLPPSATTVAQWYQNSCLRQGSVEQLELLIAFKEAVAVARETAAAALTAAAAANSTADAPEVAGTEK